MEERLIKAPELAYKVGASIQTISMWYKFKEENPDNEYSAMLPDYVRIGEKRTRYWHESDAEKLIRFRKSLPQGRNGVLGSVTQRYIAKKRENAETKAKASETKAKKVRAIKKSYLLTTEELLLKNGVEPETVSYVVQLLKEELAWRESLASNY